MLLDELFPAYDFTEVHSIRVKSSPEAAFRAVIEVTPGEINGIMRLLFFLRALPERMVGRADWAMNSRQPMLSEMFKSGFTRLAEQEPREIVFGVIAPGSIGRVWQQSSGKEVKPLNAAEFFAFSNPDYLHVVANILVSDASEPGFVIIRTESRTRALSRKSCKNFTPYWRVIRPFSGLIRRLWLRGIKRRAEREQAKAPELLQLRRNKI
jgi:hypothetical protein